MDPTGVLLPYHGSVAVRSLLRGRTPDERDWAGFVESVLRALLAQESAAATAQETLDRLERKIDQALLQDYEHSLGAALRTLASAASSRRTTEQRMHGLDQARHDLNRAYPAAPDAVARSEVQELVAVTWVLSQSAHDALDALREAATLLRDALYATTVRNSDLVAELDRRKQEGSTSARARTHQRLADTLRAVRDQAGLTTDSSELRETRKRENGARAAEIADRLGRVQTARRDLGVRDVDAPLPLARPVYIGGIDIVVAFIAGWEPASSDTEGARYASYVRARERFERIADESYRERLKMTPEQQRARCGV